MTALIIVCAVVFIGIGAVMLLGLQEDKESSSSQENNFTIKEENQRPIPPVQNFKTEQIDTAAQNISLEEKGGIDLREPMESPQGVPPGSTSDLSLIEKIKKILFKTDEFYEDEPVSDSYAKPYQFYLKVSFSVFFATLVLTFIGNAFGFGESATLIQILMPIGLIFVGIFLMAAFMHIFIMIFRGKGGFKGTFHVLAYASAANIWSVIPFVGSLIGGIWGIVVIVKGYKKVHQMSTLRAVLAYVGIGSIAVIALLAAIAVPNLLRAKMSANDALAQSTLRTLSTAAETYRTVNDFYPGNMNALTDIDPPYVNMNYCEQTQLGFTYGCEMSTQGYTFTATPVEIGTSGTTIYTMETGGILGSP